MSKREFRFTKSECGTVLFGYTVFVNSLEKGQSVTLVDAEAIQDLQRENAELKAKLWVANDRRLRTYDGALTEQDEKIKSLEAKLQMAESVIKFYSQMSVMEFKADFQQICSYNPFVTDCVVGSKATAFLTDIRKGE